MAESIKEKRSWIFTSAVHLFKGYLKGWGVFIITTAAMILLASTLRGETFFLGMLVYKTYVENFPDGTATNSNVTTVAKPTYEQILPDYLQVFPEEWNMKDFLYYWVVGLGLSILLYQGSCGFLQWWYYVRQKDTAEEWKCQPNKWLTRPNEIHEIFVGTVTMTVSSTFTSLLMCWINNGNYNTLYHEFDKYGYAYLFASFIISYVWWETVSYHFHKLTHIRFFYKHSHRLHHRYKSPTAYATFAFTPLEAIGFLIVAYSPCMFWPIHTIPFFVVFLYIAYYTLLSHSGVMLEPMVPWQPHTIFHDDHHKHCHCNFGFSSYFWDWFWETWRDPHRAYGENILNGGKGQKKT